MNIVVDAQITYIRLRELVYYQKNIIEFWVSMYTLNLTTLTFHSKTNLCIFNMCFNGIYASSTQTILKSLSRQGNFVCTLRNKIVY